MPRNVSVCILINSLSYGGAETLLVDLVEAANDRVDFTVGYFGGADELASELIETGVSVHSLNESFRFDPRSLFRCVQLLKRVDPDILHLHLPYAQTIGRLVSLTLPHLGVISTQHNVPTNYHPVTRLTERMTRRLDDATVAVSQGAERAFTDSPDMSSCGTGRWCTIHNGIDTDGFGERVSNADVAPLRRNLRIDEASTMYLSVGRYVPVKRHQDVIHSFVSADLSDAVLVLVGHGPLESELRDLIEEKQVTDSVIVTGRVPTVAPYYSFADVFISASQGEGLPITFLEAMAASLPVIGANIPGVREVVVEGETGFLCEDLPSFSNRIELLQNAAIREELGKAGRQRVSEKFDIDRMADSYIHLYREILEGKTPGGA